MRRGEVEGSLQRERRAVQQLASLERCGLHGGHPQRRGGEEWAAGLRYG